MTEKGMAAPSQAPPLLPMKGCAKMRTFEVHLPHTWEKKPGWRFHCDGILPVDEQPPCQAYVSPEQPECGEPSPVTIRVKTRLIDARIDVCINHKRQYDNRSAAARQNNQASVRDLRPAS